MKHTATRAAPASREIWAQRVEDWKNSGLSQAAYCKQHNLKPSSFYNWTYTFRRLAMPQKSTTKSAAEKTTFIPVSIRPTASEITLRCADVTLHCADTVLPEQLCQWIKALRQATCSQ